MGKAKQITHVSKCQCNVCGQVAFVVPGVEHHHCHGIKLLPGKTLPVLFSGLRHPTVRGTWEMWVAPPPPVEEPAPELQPASEAPIEAAAE